MTTESHVNPIYTLRYHKNWQEAGNCPENKSCRAEILYPLGHKTSLSTVEKCLWYRSILHLKGNHSGEKLICVKGAIWITQSGNPEDIFLRAGEAFDITQKGVVLIQGMTETYLKIINAQESIKTGPIFGDVVHRITGLFSHFF